MEKATQQGIDVKLDEIECLLLIHAGRGNHKKLEELLFSKEARERVLKSYIPASEVDEKTHEDNGKCENDKMHGNTGKEMDNAQATKSMLDHARVPKP